MTKRSEDADSTIENTESTEVAPVGDADTSAPATVPESESESHSGRRGADRRGPASSDSYPTSSGGRLGSAWVGLVLGALVTVLLLVFIIQNLDSAEVHYFSWTFSLPLGVLILFAAIAGALIMAMFAGFRILQLRMRAHRARKLSQRS